MKSLRTARFVLLLSVMTALLSTAFVAGLLHAAPMSASHGSLGRALSLQASLRALGASVSKAKTFKDVVPQDLRRASDGRFIYDKRKLMRAGAILKAHAAGTSQVDEAVQTFDVFNPSPAFAGTNLTPTNLEPVWTADETMIVFSSNRTAAGAAGTRFHLWAIAINGGVAVQLTDSTAPANENPAIPHGEFFPALSANNNQQLAFTSDANSANVQNLYVTAFSPVTVTVGNLTSPTIRGNDATGLSLTGFSNVGRPTFSPNNSDLIVFAATSVTGTYTNHSHIYYLYVSQGGFNPGNPSLPGKITDGPADDTDPAYSQDGLAIAFASTASALGTTGQAPSSNPNSSLIGTSGVRANRSLFVIGGGGAFGFGTVLNSGSPITLGSQDNFGPAWSSARRNAYTNPNTGQEYLAFARGGSPTTPHDIYYLQVLGSNGVGVEQTIPETAGAPAIKLNTDDSANAYDDIYPSWSAFSSVYSIVYASNRTVTYNDPVAGTASETAISIPDGGIPSTGHLVGAKYTGLLESQVLNLDPPSLLPYSGNEIVHVADRSGSATRVGITPGQPVTVTVRLSDREAGVDDNNVYLQIKDPDSKYQDAQGLEHKVFAKDSAYRLQTNNPYFNAKNLFTITNTQFTPGRTDPYTIQDSGSSALLMNGGGFLFSNAGFEAGLVSSYPAFNQFKDSNGNLFFPNNRGSVAGIEGPSAFLAGTALNSQTAPLTDKLIGTISIGRTGGGVNSDTVTDANGKPITDPDTKAPITNPGGDDPNLFIPWGPEFECQVVNPQFAGAGIATPTGDTATTDYHDPYFLAGIDDQQPFSGIKVATPDGNSRTANGNFVSSLRPTVNGVDVNGNFAPAEWLKLTRAATQDGQGGILYTVNWTTPTSGSDYYLDVIAFDKALAPTSFVPDNGAVGGSNWRIYDNVWGFSTASSIGNNDILVVCDYALGQKFAATTFGGQRGLLNLVPKLYGAESYVTDIDVNLLPNAINRHYVLTGASVNSPSNQILKMDIEYTPTGFSSGFHDGRSHYENGLGVGSYLDNFINDGGTSDGVSSVRSQQYSIWRILSRGPVPASVYQLYEPTIVNQPVVNDTAGKVNIPAGKAAVANRCIFWLSPFTGDVLAGAGTLSDAGTQNSLRAFVKAGGRLCVSGQDVGSALTQNGTANNVSGGFLPDVLNATLVSSNAGTHEPAPATPNTDERLTFSPSYDNNFIGDFFEFTPGRLGAPISLRDRLIRISNNNGGNVFERAYIPDLRDIANWRTDGSLDQLGPYVQSFTPFSGSTFTLNGNSVVSQIDTITPGVGAHTDLTLAPFNNTIGPIQNGNVNASTSPGGVGLIYTESLFNANGGTGSKVVYATFGLEAVSSEFYRQTTIFKPNPDVYETRNVRQGLIHNIVSYLRTGTITGTIRSTSGNGVGGSGVANATVYLQSGLGPAIPGRGTFSATTDGSGNFIIDGIEPGSYTLAAYKTGYLRATSNPGVLFVVEGDTTQAASLTLAQAPPGTITGKVSDSSGNIVPNAAVVFTATDGTRYPTTTNSLGVYTLSSIPPAVYTGTASQTGFGTDTQPATLTSGATLTVNFTLKPGPGSVTGKVTDTTGTGISGATVYFNLGGSTTPVTVQTDSTGAYSIASIPAGLYSVTATAPNFGQSASIQVVITGGSATTVPDIQLGPIANGTLGGLVTGSDGTPLTGVTLTITNTGTQQVVTVTTAASAAAPDGAQSNYGPVTLAQGAYTVTAAKNGVTTASQTITVLPNVFNRLNFTGVNGLPALHTFPAGLNFLSLPFDYTGSSFDTIFGALAVNRSHVAVWDPTAGVYALDPTPPADAIRLGVGYWIYLKTPVVLSQPGATPTGSVSVALHPFWNQIGVPSASGITASSLSFNTGGTVQSFATASSSLNHVVLPTLYRYDGSAYQPVAATDTLQPYTAYWIKVFVDTTVLIPTGH